MHPAIRHIPRLLTRHIDGPLLVLVLLMMGLGLLVLYSAGGEDIGLLQRQAVRLASRSRP